MKENNDLLNFKEAYIINQLYFALQSFSDLITGSEQDNYDLYGFAEAITGAQKVLYIRGVRRASMTKLIAEDEGFSSKEKELDAEFSRVFMKLMEEDDSDVR